MDTKNKLKLALDQARGLHAQGMSAQNSQNSQNAMMGTRDAAAFRLHALKTEMDPILSHDIATRTTFDLPIIAGERPMLWVDKLTSVVMEPDNHTFRLVQETEAGRSVLFETRHREKMVDQLTSYIAHCMVERENSANARSSHGRGFERSMGNGAGHESVRAFETVYREPVTSQFGATHAYTNDQFGEHTNGHGNSHTTHTSVPTRTVVREVVQHPVDTHESARRSHAVETDAGLDDAKQSGLHYNRMRQMHSSGFQPAPVAAQQAAPRTERILVQTHIQQHPTQFHPTTHSQFEPADARGQASVSASEGQAQSSHVEPLVGQQSSVQQSVTETTPKQGPITQTNVPYTSAYEGHNDWRSGSLSERLRQPTVYTLGQTLYIWLTGLGFGAASFLAAAIAFGKFRF